MERSVEIATGESVAFSYELAGLGSRFFAVAIDFTIQLLVAAAALALFVWLGLSQGAPGAANKLDPTTKFGLAIVEGIGIFAAFLLFFGYFIFFEWRFAGRTPGKRLLGIRVVRDGGFPLDFTSAVVRNVVRMLEFSLGFYIFSAVATLLSPMNRRLGDMAAGTLVVREHRFERAATLAELDERRARDDSLVRDLSEPERELVRRYVERRASLDAAARASLASRIATGVRPKLAASFAHLDDDALLVHVAGDV
ncbi:MAG: RDD family protein [Candidatus Eremiobacteraeota bacterium]|nr:RDD family protein [Candidatus Eremiobacteraeota bacterium]